MQAELLFSKLQGCLARVVSFLVQAEAAHGRPMPDVSSPTELHVDSVDEGKADLYGCFSPRVGICTSWVSAASMTEAAEVVSSVLQVMPELQELCGVSSVILPMELVSLEALEVASMPSPPPSEPCRSPAIVDSGGLDASVTTSHVVYLSDEIDKAGVLAPNSEALLEKRFATCSSV
jgi:hypothetical protein